MRGIVVARLAVSVMFLAVGFPVRATAQDVKTSQNISITLRGILSGTLFAQDADFGLGNGQQGQFVVAERSRWVHGGDIRNLRIGLGIAGPEIKTGWHGNANVELDFFGPFATATGAFGDEQPTPRLRLAYVDLTNGRTTWRFGQDWSLTLGNIPQSTSHIGFPLGWGPGGFIGWRFTQIKLIKTLSGASAKRTTRLQIALLNGSWAEAATDNQFNAGERSAPQVEARLDWGTTRSSWYVVGHVDQKNLVPGPNLTSWAGEAGFSTTRGDVSLAANAHMGRGMGHHFAQIVQFGDIKGWGAWGQVGYNLNSKWSLWGFYGTERPNATDITNNAVVDANGAPIALAARRFSSWLTVPMLRYKSGPYSLGLEWLHNDTQVGPSANNKIRSGNQVLLSTRFDF